jgi:predicted nucleic acid-binding protein
VARARVEAALHDLFQRLLRDLRFHQRLVARLVVNEETLDRVLDTVQAEGAERVAEMLREPEIQQALARGINEAVVELLRRPVTDVLGTPEDPSVLRTRETLSGWVMGVARDPETRTFLVEKLRTGMGKASEGTWGDLLRTHPPGKGGGGVVAAARSPAAREVYRGAIRGASPGSWTAGSGARPTGSRFPGAPARLEAAFSEPLWDWLQGQIPEVVRTLDVGRRVEAKVLGYPVEQLEALVRRVTERELRLIVRLGYVLGAVIGLTSVIRAAARTSRLHTLSFWDALIVEAAQAAGASELLSEDLQHGRHFGSLLVRNPFRPE